MKITLLDLFSGAGGFHLGLEKAGFEVDAYFSEIDKHAVAVYKHKFKQAKYVGSVTDVRGADLPKIDILTMGSPCQSFSLAGKRKGLEGKSGLIREGIRLIEECRPSVFIWENVKGTFSSSGGQDFAAVLKAFSATGLYTIEWELQNTKSYLPQNRERIFLVGYIGGGSRPKIFPLPENDRSVDGVQRQQGNTCALTARYEANANGSYIIERKLDAQEVELIEHRGHKNKAPKRITNGIVPTLRAESHGHETKVVIKSNTKKGYEVANEGDSINYSVPNSKTRRGRIGKGVAQTLDTATNQAVIVAMRGRGDDNTQTLESNKQGTTNALTSVQKDNLVMTNRIRRLTPVECERLQGFPDNWTECGYYDPSYWALNKKKRTVKEKVGLVKIFDTQRYKLMGNAVTVDVVAAVATQIKKVINPIG